MPHLGLLTLLLVLCSLNQVASKVYNITTNASDLCIVWSCLTLSQLAANSSHYLHSNTTLVFLPGTHYLSNVNLTLSNVDNFVMKSENSAAKTKCTSNSHIHFSQSQCIRITNLKFIGCGGNQVKYVKEFLVVGTEFDGQAKNGTALRLIETTAQIINSTFVYNRGSYAYREASYAHREASYAHRECHYRFNDYCRSRSIGSAIIATNSSVDINQSKFEDNEAGFGAAIYAVQHSIINMNCNLFKNNSAIEFGGVLYSYSSTVTIEASEFYNNTAIRGGVLRSRMSAIIIKTSEFGYNRASDYGGVLDTWSNSNITIKENIFYRNSVAMFGGGILASVTIEASEFHGNQARLYGGVLDLYYSTHITIESSEFHGNNARYLRGGVMQSYRSTIKIGGCNFTENSSPIGSVIYAENGSKVQYSGYILIDSNSASRYDVIYLSKSEFRGHHSKNCTFSNNLGSLVAFNSNVTLIGYAVFMNNHPSQTASGDFEEGGAITTFLSNIFFDGVCSFQHNHAMNGGAIHSSKSKIYVNGKVTIASNAATRNGGGVYLSTTELNCQQRSTIVFCNNTAALKGGGLHAISSSIEAVKTRYAGTKINFTNNTAKFG